MIFKFLGWLFMPPAKPRRRSPSGGDRTGLWIGALLLLLSGGGG